MDSKLKEKEFIKLEDRIWKTYQSRIICATKLLNRSKLLDFYSTIYTICLTIMSVSSLIIDDNIIKYGCVIISIIVMGLVLFGNSMNYKDRYINMKDNYLKLTDLYYKCVDERINKTFDLSKIYNEYSKLLNVVENHSKNDYLTFQINDEEEKNKISIYNKIKIYFFKTLFILLNVIFIITPIIIIVLSFIRLL